MVDMAHFAGLVAGKVLTGDYDPVPHAHVITTTTHKSLRGPRGGHGPVPTGVRRRRRPRLPMVLGGPMRPRHGGQGGGARRGPPADVRHLRPAVATTPRHSPRGCMRRGVRLVTGGTDNHLVLLDVVRSRAHRPPGRVRAPRCWHRHQPQQRPRRTRTARWYTSGIRLGTPALTSRGFDASDFDRVGVAHRGRARRHDTGNCRRWLRDEGPVLSGRRSRGSHPRRRGRTPRRPPALSRARAWQLRQRGLFFPFTAGERRGVGGQRGQHHAGSTLAVDRSAISRAMLRRRVRQSQGAVHVDNERGSRARSRIRTRSSSGATGWRRRRTRRST